MFEVIPRDPQDTCLRSLSAFRRARAEIRARKARYHPTTNYPCFGGDGSSCDASLATCIQFKACLCRRSLSQRHEISPRQSATVVGWYCSFVSLKETNTEPTCCVSLLEMALVGNAWPTAFGFLRHQGPRGRSGGHVTKPYSFKKKAARPSHTT